MTTYTFALGFFVLWVVVGAAWGEWVNPVSLFDRPPLEYGSIIALGVAELSLAILWLWGLSNVPDVSRGNYLFFLKPVIAALLAAFILDDDITTTQIWQLFSRSPDLSPLRSFTNPLRGGSARRVRV